MNQYGLTCAREKSIDDGKDDNSCSICDPKHGKDQNTRSKASQNHNIHCAELVSENIGQSSPKHGSGTLNS